jgi:hypothetical protein
MWRFLVPFLAVIFVGSAASVSLAESDEDWRIQRLNERYDDFFARRKADAAYNRERQVGSSEVKKERQKWDSEMNRARVDFIVHRPPPADLGPALTEWNKEHDRQEQEAQHAERRYSDFQHRLEMIEAKAKHIPDNVEYNLEP